MKTSLTNYRNQLIENLLTQLWRQWSAMGVAGHSGSAPSRIIDPEALLLFSTVIARHDARMFDEMLDWLDQNGSWISIQRLGTMLKEDGLGDPTVLAAIADYLAKKNRNNKWELLARKAEIAGGDNELAVKPLFPGIPMGGEPDELFLKHALERGPIELRGMSLAPRTDKPANLLFKLRALFGRQARAEVIAWLLSNGEGHPAEIARQTGYYRRTVQIVLNELAVSDLVRSIQTGREKYFAIQQDQWRLLMDWHAEYHLPRWITWPTVFKFLQSALEIFSAPDIEERSERYLAIRFRELLESHLTGLRDSGLGPILQATPSLQGSQMVDAMLNDIETIIRTLDETE